MGVFGGGDIGCQNGHRHKNQQQGKPDNGSRIPENSIQCKFKFPQPRMGFGHMLAYGVLTEILSSILIKCFVVV
jgi:hypothetical protein